MSFSSCTSSASRTRAPRLYIYVRPADLLYAPTQIVNARTSEGQPRALAAQLTPYDPRAPIGLSLRAEAVPSGEQEMWKWVLRVGGGAIALVLVTMIGCLIAYASWLPGYKRELEAGSPSSLLHRWVRSNTRSQARKYTPQNS